MKICRFDRNHIGVVEGDQVADVSAALKVMAPLAWPLPPGDPLILAWDQLLPAIKEALPSAKRVPIASVRLESPVSSPNKLIGAPINYNDHIAESQSDQGIAYGRVIKHISEFGLFLKANSCLVGQADGVALRFPDKRNDHEAELAVVIGKTGTNIKEADALSYVAAYSIGLDMTVRGPEVPSYRKSIDTYGVLGPWLVTADEIPDPDNLDFFLTVNGEDRQRSNTKYLVYGVKRLIEYASQMYTLYPGDVIFTGTPAGVAPVVPGDVMHVEFEKVGAMDVKVRAA